MQASLFDNPTKPLKSAETNLADSLACNNLGAESQLDWKEMGGAPLATFENEFWTARQRQCHSLHEISYRACFKPQLPRFFITRCTKLGDTVLDPFMGRGTTPLETALLGRRAIGSDLNPVCAALIHPRLAPPNLADIENRLATVKLDLPKPQNEDLLAFFHPQTLGELEAWKGYFAERIEAGKFDSVDEWIRMVACNRLTGHSPGFFSVYTMPPNQAVTVESQRKINVRLNQQPTYRDTKKLILKKSRALLRDGVPPVKLPHQILTASADNLEEIPANSVQLIVTSPPFLDVVNYKSDNWLRAWFCDVELDTVSLWQERKLPDWHYKMQDAFTEWHRVLRPGGLIAFETGEIQNGKLLLEDTATEAALACDLQAECLVINTQQFTKTSNCWGVDNMEKGTNSNRVLLLRKN